MGAVGSDDRRRGVILTGGILGHRLGARADLAFLEAQQSTCPSRSEPATCGDRSAERGGSLLEGHTDPGIDPRQQRAEMAERDR